MENNTEYDRIKTKIKEWLTNETPKAIILRGAWGIGKSHLINELCKDKDVKKSKEVITVSLFGLSNIAELKEELTGRSFNNSQNQDTKWAVKNLAKGLLNLGKTVGVPADAIITISGSLLTTLALDNLKYRIICLDDWERSNINTKDLMGFIEYLKIANKCRVILIFNDKQQEETSQEELHTYEEKVFDYNVEMNIEPKDAFSIVTAGSKLTEHTKKFAQKKLGILSLNNIRVVQKICRNAEELITDLEIEDEPKKIEKLLSSLILFSWAKYLPEGESPDVEWLENFNFYMETQARIISEQYSNTNEEKMPETGKQKGMEEREARYEKANIVNEYGYFSKNEIDDYIIAFLEMGYLNYVDEYLLGWALDRILSREETDKKFSKILKLYESGFGNDDATLFETLTEYKDTFLSDFEEGFYSDDDAKTAVNHIIHYYRILEKNEACTDFISDFVNSPEWTSVFEYEDTIRQQQQHYDIDEELSEAISDEYKKKFSKPIALDAVIYNISYETEIDRYTKKALNLATDEELLKTFIECDIITLAGFLETMRYDKKLSKRMFSIVDKLPQDTPLNKDRLKSIKP